MKAWHVAMVMAGVVFVVVVVGSDFVAAALAWAGLGFGGIFYEVMCDGGGGG